MSSERPPVLVAVPGTLCAPQIFDALRDRLRPDVHVAAVSWMTGDGPWTIPAVAACIAETVAAAHDSPVLLAGHSTGGAIAMRLAIDRPELVSGLLLVGTGAHMHGHGDVDAIIDRVEREWGPTLLEAILRRSFDRPVSAPFHGLLVDYAKSVSQRAVVQVLRSQRDLDLTPELACIGVPTVVVHGTLDPTRPVERARELAAAIPHAELRVVESGHSPVYEAPHQVADAVRALVRRSAG